MTRKLLLTIFYAPPARYDVAAMVEDFRLKIHLILTTGVYNALNDFAVVDTLLLDNRWYDAIETRCR
jgi:hypothetical protein